MIEVGQLKSISSLESLSDEALVYLADVLQKRSYGKGEPIFNENTEGGELYLLGKGTVKITKRAKEGEAQGLAVVKEGEFLGMMTFFEGGRHSANALAAEDCTIFIMGRSAFDTFIERFPADTVKMYRLFVQELIASLRAMNEKYIDMVNYMWRWR